MSIAACPRIKVARLNLPLKWLECLEQNQQIASCCRHPENHEIEALFSDADEAEARRPNIYIFHCTCGKRHIRFMCSGGERPWWEVR